jgi:hypothetical protein
VDTEPPPREEEGGGGGEAVAATWQQQQQPGPFPSLLRGLHVHEKIVTTTTENLCIAAVSFFYYMAGSTFLEILFFGSHLSFRNMRLKTRTPHTFWFLCLIILMLAGDHQDAANADQLRRTIFDLPFGLAKTLSKEKFGGPDILSAVKTPRDLQLQLAKVILCLDICETCKI